MATPSRQAFVWRLTSRGFTTRAAFKEAARTLEGAAMLEAPELAPPAPSSACPEGPEPRSGEGVNPMLCAVARCLSKPTCRRTYWARASSSPSSGRRIGPRECSWSDQARVIAMVAAATLLLRQVHPPDASREQQQPVELIQAIREVRTRTQIPVSEQNSPRRLLKKP